MILQTRPSDLQPTKGTRGVKKERGILGPDGRSEMYQLFHDPKTGIKVYFLDGISRTNHDNLVVAIPKPVPAPSIPQSYLPPIPPSATSVPATPTLTKQTDGFPISPELFAWYVQLQKEREVLDTTDPAAIALFNNHAANYHATLKKAQIAKQK